ncbi:hypothetical protein Ancab_040463 [Ancistrocladus abbreviatus]
MAQGEQRSEIESGNNQSTSAVDHGEEMSTVIRIPKGASTPPALPLWLAEIISAKKDEQPKNNCDLDVKPVCKCKIQRVPPILRETESSKDCYEPLMISLGPFHHGKPQLQRMEKLKISMMQRFIDGTGRSAELVYAKFLEVARNAKTEYYMLEPEENSIDDDRFLRILFVDLCFVIQFIHAGMDWHEYGLTKMKSHEIAFVQRDLFLLENQLPFPVLKALMILRFSEDEFFEIIKRFISDIITIRPKRASWHQRMQTLLLGKKQSFELTDRAIDIIRDADADYKPVHLLHALQMQLVHTKKMTPHSGQSEIWYSYRSVTELKAAGVHFRPRGRSSRLTDIKFESHLIYGVLSLRPMVIDDQAKARFLNLCAFEALPDAPDDLGITSYLCFLDSIIDSAEDVKELRSKGILFNFLGSDEQVADMFNDITDRLVPNLEAYTQVKSAIEKHYNSRVRTWIAQFLHEHFSSPWTVLGLVLALFAIALSIIQTYYQLHPPT